MSGGEEQRQNGERKNGEPARMCSSSVLQFFSSLVQRERGAFTLVEMLVAVGVFGVVVGLTSNLFLSASRSQTRTTNRGTLEADARLVIERIAREVREGFVDPGADDVDLAVRSRTGDLTYFVRRSGTCVDGRQGSCVAIGRTNPATGTSEWASLTSRLVAVDAFEVIAIDAPQPYVTVRIALSIEDRAGERLTTEAQTTVVSRVYVQ